MDYQLKINNARVRETCPGCGASFKAEIGPWPFVPGTIEVICDDCATGLDLTNDADRSEVRQLVANHGEMTEFGDRFGS